MQALKNIRVIDLSHVIAGPTASHYLASQGAEVIKVENPRSGDSLRYSGKISFDTGISASFASINGGKQSLAIDLKHPPLLEAVYRLVETADIFIENFKPGVVKKLGLDFEKLTTINPNLIYVSISGYGQNGKLSEYGAYDHVIQALTGMMMMGGVDNSPLKVGFPVIDSATGMIAAQSILAALFQRERNPGKIRLDISMVQAAVQLMLPQISRVLAQGEDMPRIGNRGFSESPGASTFQCSDGWISIAANTSNQFHKLCKILNISDLEKDPLLIDPKSMTGEHGFVKAVNKEEVQRILTQACLKTSASQLESDLNNAAVPAARVRTTFNFIKEALDDELVAISTQKVQYPNGTTTNFMNGFMSSADSESAPLLAPKLGEHTENILTRLGFSRKAIEELKRERKVHY